MNQKWDYLVETIQGNNGDDFQRRIDKVAKDGWELVSVNMPLLFFKRPKSEETAAKQAAEAQPEGTPYQRSQKNRPASDKVQPGKGPGTGQN